MAVTFDFSGLPKYEARVRDAAAKGLNDAAVTLQKSMKNVQQQTPRTGKKNPKHVPSKPGEPPARQDGHLFRNIVHQQATPANLVARAGTKLKYGRFLEFGHMARFGSSQNPKAGPPTYVHPRPWVFVALQDARAKMVEAFKSGARASLRTGGARK